MAALIFDFDGTIVDTETPEYLAWKEAFAEYGCELPWEHWAALIGRGVNEEHERPGEMLARLTGRPEIAEIEQKRQRERILAAIDAAPVREGIVELLEAARTRGVTLAVASSSRHDWVDRLLSRHDLLEAFSVISCVGDVPRGKPFPDTYFYALKQLGIGPGDAVAIEDSVNGVRAANEAGIKVIAFPNPVTSSLDFSSADLVCRDLVELSIEDVLALIGR